jgi:hypothetical protein
MMDRWRKDALVMVVGLLMYAFLSGLNYDQRCLFGYRIDVCVEAKAYHVYRAQSRIESFLVMI